MPSASAADGYGKSKNTLKWLSLCFLLLCTFKLIANVKVRNYSEGKLQCFLSLVSKGLETNKFQSLITIENEKMTKDSESYENFSLAANETNVDLKSLTSEAKLTLTGMWQHAEKDKPQRRGDSRPNFSIIFLRMKGKMAWIKVRHCKQTTVLTCAMAELFGDQQEESSTLAAMASRYRIIGSYQRSKLMRDQNRKPGQPGKLLGGRTLVLAPQTLREYQS